MKVVSFLLYFLILNKQVFSQTFHSLKYKPPIDSSVYNKWPYISEGQSPRLTNDGKFVAYAIYNVPTPEDNSTLVIQSTDGLWKKQIVGLTASDVEFSNDSRYAFYLKNDSLNLFNLQSNEEQSLPGIVSFKVAKGSDRLAYLVKNTSSLTVKDLQTNRELKFSNVSDYFFSSDGQILLFQKEVDREKLLQWVQLSDGSVLDVYKGEKLSDYSFDDSYSQLSFLAGKTINKQTQYHIGYYKKGLTNATVLVSDQTLGLDSSWVISSGDLRFTPDGNNVIFKIKQATQNSSLSKKQNSVDVWSYKDENLQPWQLKKLQQDEKFPRSYYAMIKIKDKKVTRINYENESSIYFMQGNIIVTNGDYSNYDYLIKPYMPSLYNFKITTTERTLLPVSIPDPQLKTSPNGKYIIYWNNDRKKYESFDIENFKSISLAADIAAKLIDTTKDTPGKPLSYGFGGFYNRNSVLLYDRYDIWIVDLEGKRPSVCITNGMGKKSRIIFRLARIQINGEDKNELCDSILLIAFNPKTKENGFYKVLLNDKKLQLLKVDSWAYQIIGLTGHDKVAVNTPIIKATDTSLYIVTRQNAMEPPNLFSTSDFKDFTRLTDIQPHKKYNWLTPELITWKMPDGRYSQGILYKPENFDSNKKYPIIFHFYEKLSDGLNLFKMPGWSMASVDIPTYVSNGYLVFVPDIYYTIGHPGQSVVNCVISAAKYLAKRPYVDSKRMGLQGHSFGGYEVNYLIAHSNIFAAAAEAAGPSNLISGYGTVGMGNKSLQFIYEHGQNRIRYTLWQRPDLYIENSPIFKADKITTPLLIMHNKEDDAVPWSHGVELFNACRRLGKPCWMLTYDCFPGQGHQLANVDQDKDYTIRLQQFFDHYLKGMRAPKWMTKGVPANKKGLFSGIELDKEIRK